MMATKLKRPRHAKRSTVFSATIVLICQTAQQSGANISLQLQVEKLKVELNRWTDGVTYRQEGSDSTYEEVSNH